MSRLSIRARLTLAFAAALLLVLALTAVFVYLRLQAELTDTIDDGLQSRANDVTALVARSDDGRVGLRGGLFEGEEGFVQVLDPNGRVLSTTLPRELGPALEPELVDRAARETVIVEDRRIEGIEEDVRILARPAGGFVVVAGASTGDRDESLAGIASAFLIGAPLALLLASVLGYMLAARSLAPVEDMRRRASEITLERSGERLPLPAAKDEIRRLGETLNAMLDRVEASLRRERVFVADASHELRTPLAVLRAELELASRPGRSEEELRAAVGSAAEEVERLTRLAEDLLVIARSDQGPLPIEREHVDVNALLARIRDRFGHRMGDTGRTITVDAPDGLHAHLDVLRVEQALGNLVDNALRHGAGEVRLSARQEDGTLLLEVADHGPGFPPGFEDQAFERFTRGDEGRTEGGAGLGLAIVRAVVAAHGGRVEVVSPSGAPTTLRIALPLSSKPHPGGVERAS